LREAKSVHPDSQVILMTGRPNIQDAVDVIKMGAYDYLVKPFSSDTVKMTIGRAVEKIDLERENIKLRELMSLFQISEAMGSIIDVDALLNMILTTAVKEFEADVALILFSEGDNLETRKSAAVGLELNELGRIISEHCQAISRRSLEKSGPLIFNDPDNEYNWGERSIKSSMCQPLLAKGKTLGILNVVRINNNHQFTTGHLAGLSLLGSKAATAIENSRLYEDLKKTYIATVEALANAVEARDSYTRGHTERVYHLSRAIAEELGWSPEQFGILQIGALLHDIGKIGVPDSILNKPGPLTPEEAEIMRRHPLTGAKMVEAIPFLKSAMPYILYHHERHDGKGYPSGLAGDQIPLEGRLLSVVDTIDAYTSDRPYRKGRSLLSAMEEIQRFCGTQFDPTVVEACLSAYHKGKLNFLFDEKS
jgi:putative nucleotidyltransferase with HDIG domain